MVEFVIPDFQSEVIFDSPFSDLLPGLSRCNPDQPEHLRCQEGGETCGRPDCPIVDEHLSEKNEFCTYPSGVLMAFVLVPLCSSYLSIVFFSNAGLRVSYPMSNVDADNHNEYVSYLDQSVTIQHHGGQSYGVFNIEASLGQVETHAVEGDYQTGVELIGYLCEGLANEQRGLKLGQDFAFCVPRYQQIPGVEGLIAVEVIRDVICEGRFLIDSEMQSLDGGMSTVEPMGDNWMIRSVVVARYFQRAQTDPNGNMFFSCSGGADISISPCCRRLQEEEVENGRRLQEEEVESGNFNVKFSLAVPEGGRADGLVASGVLPRASAVTTAAGVMAIAVALL